MGENGSMTDSCDKALQNSYNGSTFVGTCDGVVTNYNMCSSTRLTSDKLLVHLSYSCYHGNQLHL